MASNWRRFENRSSLATLPFRALLVMTTLYFYPISTFCISFISYQLAYPEGIRLTYLKQYRNFVVALFNMIFITVVEAPARALVEQPDALLKRDGCNVGTSDVNGDDMREELTLVTIPRNGARDKRLLNPAGMITHIGELDARRILR